MRAKRIAFRGMREGLCEALLKATAGDGGQPRNFLVFFSPGTFHPVCVLRDDRTPVKPKLAAQVGHAFLRALWRV
jgi:hypothetical protein